MKHLTLSLLLMCGITQARADDLLLCGWNDFPISTEPSPLEHEMCESLKDCKEVLDKDETFASLSSCYDLVQEYEDAQIALRQTTTELRRARLQVSRLKSRRKCKGVRG